MDQVTNDKPSEQLVTNTAPITNDTNIVLQTVDLTKIFNSSVVKLLASLIMGILLMTLTEVTSADSESFSNKMSGQTLKVPIGAHEQSSRAFPWTGHITILSLDPVGKVKQGQDPKFTGKLLDEHRKGVQKATVEIIDDTASNSKSPILAKAITNSDGLYESEWVAKSKVGSSTIVVFAQFNGNSEYLGSVSDKILVTVISK